MQTHFPCSTVINYDENATEDNTSNELSRMTFLGEIHDSKDNLDLLPILNMAAQKADEIFTKKKTK